MTIGFLRPTGAAADVKELEYVSALHQTDLEEMRMDGSISDKDIVLFLLSRYGIDVTPEQVRSTIIHGLGGGDEEKDDCIDLMEMVCMLMIPTLLKATTPDLPQGLVRPRDGLLEFVLDMILHDTTGSHTPKKLDKRLIQRILVSYGEVELASNEDLIDEMLKAAQTPDGKLDIEAFSKGLTHDVQLYDIRNETRRSTNFDDVFLTKNHREDWSDDDEEAITSSRQLARERKAISQDVKRRYTAPAIDMVAGTYRSKAMIVLLWAAFIVTYFAYNFGKVASGEGCSDDIAAYEYGKSWSDQARAMACEVEDSILTWLVTFATASAYAMGLIGFGSIGNNIACRRFYLPLIAIAAVVGGTVLPFYGFEGNFYLPTVSLLLGISLIFLNLCHIFSMVLPEKWTQRSALSKAVFGSDIVKAEANIKKAASFKINLMTNNALWLEEQKNKDTVMETHFGQALMVFAKAGKNFVPAGGFIWTWKLIFTGAIFNKEGIWLSARLMASNMTQFVVTVFVLIAGIGWTRKVANEYDPEKAKDQAGGYIGLLFNTAVSPGLVSELVGKYSLMLTDFLSTISQKIEGIDDTCFAGNFTNYSQAGCELVEEYFSCDPDASNDYLCTLLDYAESNVQDDGRLALGLLNATGFKAEQLLQSAQQALGSAANSSIDSVYPSEKYMVMIPMILGSVTAFITALSLAVTYIPSVTSTTLQLRSGVIPTLRNPRFNRYRVAADQVTILMGSMFWGCLIASILVGGIVGVIVFLFLWQATLVLVQKVVAIVIGISVVFAIKYICVSLCRVSMYKAFYRKKPAGANIVSLVLECTNFALSVGFVTLRMCKLLVMAALYVGRIDTPFLAPGVGRIKQFGDMELDSYPTIFLMDILSHEAHRHPYIEQMGVMYLMKLRYGENFGKRAGSTWRLIFVYALMPWLNKYRILDRNKEEPDKTGLDTAVPVSGDERDTTNSGDENDTTTRPSLVTKFQSLHKIYQDDQEMPPVVSLTRGSRGRPSIRASKLMAELGSLNAKELEKAEHEAPEKSDRADSKLQTKIDSLESEVMDLQAEVERLTNQLLSKTLDKE